MVSKTSRSSGRSVYGGGSCGAMEAGACLPAGSLHWNICLWGCSRCGGEDEATLRVQLSCQVVAGRIPRSQLSFQIFVKCFAFLYRSHFLC